MDSEPYSPNHPKESIPTSQYPDHVFQQLSILPLLAGKAKGGLFVETISALADLLENLWPSPLGK